MSDNKSSATCETEFLSPNATQAIATVAADAVESEEAGIGVDQSAGSTMAQGGGSTDEAVVVKPARSKITYTEKRPADYWAERGYDWYSGH